MARYRRIYSETGIYHVMCRGNDKTDIFIDDEDKLKYLNILGEKMEESNYTLYAYCIMSNHSHLILKEENQTLPNIMRRINTSYAQYFNRKYGRVGHVFQGRYRSEPIGDDSYLLTAIRYVHNNPVKAKLVENCEDFRWCSYNHYIGKCDDKIIDKDFILALFSKSTSKKVKLFKAFSTMSNDDKLIDICDIEELEIKGYMDAEIYIKEFLERESLELENLNSPKNREKRNQLIVELRQKSNLSIRDIGKLLKIGRNIVANAK